MYVTLSADQTPVGGDTSRTSRNTAWAHPASNTMGTGSFPGLQRPVRSLNHLVPYSTKVKERVELYHYSHRMPSWQVAGRTLPSLYLIPSKT